MNEARYSRLTRSFPERAEELFERNEKAAMERYSTCSSSLCPVDMSLSFLRLCHAQTCGKKCVPCTHRFWGSSPLCSSRC